MRRSIRTAKKMVKRSGRTTKKTVANLPPTPLMQGRSPRWRHEVVVGMGDAQHTRTHKLKPRQTLRSNYSTSRKTHQNPPKPDLPYATLPDHLTTLPDYHITTLPPPAPLESCFFVKLLKPGDQIRHSNPSLVLTSSLPRTGNTDCEPTPTHFAAHPQPHSVPAALVRNIVYLL